MCASRHAGHAHLGPEGGRGRLTAVIGLLTGALVVIFIAARLSNRVGAQAGPPQTDVQITTGPDSAVETAIAIDPTDPDHIVGSAVVTFGDPSRRSISNFTYVTRDAGRTWTAVEMPNPENRVQGDDAVAITADGRVVRTYIAFSQLRNPRGLHPTTGIWVALSDDGGLTWRDPIPVVDHVNTIEPFEDKPYPAVDIVRGSPYEGSVYIAWTRFTRYGSPAPQDSSFIYFVYSRDRGETWHRPLRLPAAGGDARDGDNTVEGAVPAVGPGGEVYLSWSGPRGIEFTRSDDGGASWSEARTVLDQPGGWDIGIADLGRANGMPVTGCDISSGQHRGTVYITWADLRNNGGQDGDADVFVARSEDGGRSWSEPVRVHADPVGNGRDQFFTWLGVDPVDGSVNVVYYDRRAGEGRALEVWLARSEDGGRTFTERRISSEGFRPDRRRFFGDYNGISAYGGRVACLWTHSLWPACGPTRCPRRTCCALPS